MSDDAVPSRRAAMAVLGVLLVAFVAATGLRPLNVPDEGRYADVARWMLRSGDLVTPRLAGVPFLHKPPLFYWLEAASFATFGVHVWSARLVPALLGFAGCALTYAAGARLHGRRAGILAAIVLAANPYYFVASEYVNHDLCVAIFISAALLLFAVADRAEAPARGRLLLAAWAACGLAVMTKGLIGLVLPLGIVGAWIAYTGRWGDLARSRLPSGLVLATAITLPWHLAAERANPGLLHELFVVQHFQRYAASGFNNARGAWFYPAVLAGGLLPWTPLLPGALARAWRAWRADPERGRADLLLLLWPLVVVLFFTLPASKIAGYALPALPPLALLLGRHLDALASEGVRSRALAAAAAVVGVAGVALLVAPFVPTLHLAPAHVRAGIALAGLVALAAGAVALRAARAGAPHEAALPLALFLAALVAGGMPAVRHVTGDSAREVARELARRARPGDTVVLYGRYYYDVPFYLDRGEPPVVAERWSDPQIPSRDNWQSELLAGRDREPRSASWLVEYEAVPERCRVTRCFLLVPPWHEPRLRRDVPGVVRLSADERIALYGPPDPLRGGAAPAHAAAEAR